MPRAPSPYPCGFTPLSLTDALFAFYPDVLCDACPIPSQIIPPTALDVATVGKLAAAPWGRDQKLAAHAT